MKRTLLLLALATVIVLAVAWYTLATRVRQPGGPGGLVGELRPPPAAAAQAPAATASSASASLPSAAAPARSPASEAPAEIAMDRPPQRSPQDEPRPQTAREPSRSPASAAPATAEPIPEPATQQPTPPVETATAQAPASTTAPATAAAPVSARPFREGDMLTIRLLPSSGSTASEHQVIGQVIQPSQARGALLFGSVKQVPSGADAAPETRQFEIGIDSLNLDGREIPIRATLVAASEANASPLTILSNHKTISVGPSGAFPSGALLQVRIIGASH